MSITVIIARDDNGAPTTREVYESATKFSDEGGNLSIISGRPQLIALYGSGNWLSVHVDDNVQVITEKPAEDDDDDDDDMSFDFGSSDDDSSSDADSDSTDTDAESSESSDLDDLLASDD